MRYATAILSILIFTSCLSGMKNDNITNRSNGKIPAYLDSIAPYMKEFAVKSDTIYDIRLHEEGYILLVVGKIVEKDNIHALVYEEKDTLLNFYYYNKTEVAWEYIGSERPSWDMIYDIGYEDMNNDGRNEVITFSYPNMNGNTWKDIFYISQNNDSICLAGGFFSSSFTTKKDTQTVETDYFGSWYMPLIQTLYKWRGEKLIRVKEIMLELKEDAPMGSEDYLLSYYENTSLKSDSVIDSLTLVYNMPYIEKKHKHLWDTFFEDSNDR